MKPQKLNKKLSLHKDTIAHLNYRDQQEVHGGAITYTPIITKADTFCYNSCEPTYPYVCASCSCYPPCYLP